VDRSSRDAYVAGLKLLARRELSELQLRQRLLRREHDEAAVDDAILQLKSERALDDRRVAGALARNEILTKKHGRLRAQRQLEAAGIAPPAAREALDEVFTGVEGDEILEAALAKRLRGGRSIEDDAEFRRLYRFLIGQGFEPGRVMATLRARRT
jgi:regulatory protein